MNYKYRKIKLTHQRKENIMKIKKIITTILSIALLITNIGFVSITTEADSYVNPAISDNINKHNYIEGGDSYLFGYWASPIYSYIDGVDNGYQRLEYIDNKGLYVENYNWQFQCTKSNKITMELPYFGGYYCGDRYNYIVFGQSNENMDDTTEVLRIVKYDKSWNRIRSASVYGIYSTHPFTSALQMDEANDYLVIRNGVSADTILINTGDMTVVKNIEYTNLFFNLFVKMDGEYIVAVNHEVDNPRSIEIIKYKSGTTTKTLSTVYSKKNLVEIPGESGDNYTGVQVGGFEISSSGYLVADARRAYSGNTLTENDNTYNVYIQYIDKNLNNANEVKITDYAANSGVTATNPYLIKINNERFLVLWQKKSSKGRLEKSTSGIYFTYIDSKGNKLSNIGYINNGALSDCEPKLINNKLVWYVTNSSERYGAPTFYTATPNTAGYTLTISETKLNATNIYAFEDIRNGNKVTLPNDSTPTIFIYGRPNGCYNTNAAVKTFGEIYDNMNSDVKIVLLDIDNRDDATLIDAANQQNISNNIILTTVGTYGDNYEIYRTDLNDAGISGSFTLPFIVFRNSNGDIVVTSTGYQTKSDIINNLKKINVSVSTPVSKITLNQTSANIETGKIVTLKATVIPDDATNKSVKWSSSNTNVATVDSYGKVTAKSTGAATITCSASDGSGVSAKCSVTVTKPQQNTNSNNNNSSNGGKTTNSNNNVSTNSGKTTSSSNNIGTSTNSGKTTSSNNSTGTNNGKTTNSNNSKVNYVSMYRLYNPNSGEHFYTANATERDNLSNLGWRYEGVAWNAPEISDIPVYRLYNPNAGDHHYTTSATERDNLVSLGWKYEGIGWYSTGNDGQALHRLYNPNAKAAGAHHYTTNADERDNLISLGWRYEGIAWYGGK